MLISKTKLNRVHSIIPYLVTNPGALTVFRYLVGPPKGQVITSANFITAPYARQTRLLRGFVSIRVVKYVMRSAFQEDHRLTKSSESLRERSAIAGGDGSGQHLVAEHSPSLTHRELEPELVRHCSIRRRTSVGW